MTTVQELLDWSLQYKDVAGDGFKAEMIWLAKLSGNDSHSASEQTFTEPEWKSFAHYLYPLKYLENPNISGLVKDTLYENEQIEAIKDLPNLIHSHSVNLNGSLNEVCHRVIWTARFGLDKFSNFYVEQYMAARLTEPLSNDDYAKIIVCLRCLNDSSEYSRISDILNQELTINTYHEQLCSLISNLLR